MQWRTGCRDHPLLIGEGRVRPNVEAVRKPSTTPARRHHAPAPPPASRAAAASYGDDFEDDFERDACVGGAGAGAAREVGRTRSRSSAEGRGSRWMWDFAIPKTAERRGLRLDKQVDFEPAGDSDELGRLASWETVPPGRFPARGDSGEWAAFTHVLDVLGQGGGRPHASTRTRPSVSPRPPLVYTVIWFPSYSSSRSACA